MRDQRKGRALDSRRMHPHSSVSKPPRRAGYITRWSRPPRRKSEDFTLRMTCSSLLTRDKGKPFVQKKSGNFAFPLLK